jgi:hypothetical protein
LKVRRNLRFLAALAIAFAPALIAAQVPVKITGPTVIAFFAPASEDDVDGNDALDDFRFYAEQVREPFAKAKIAFHVVDARSFRVSMRGKIRVVRPKKDVGYYFVAPGKKPLFHYGVDTDEGLFKIAREYFGLQE